jgi:hypothetical protein
MSNADLPARLKSAANALLNVDAEAAATLTPPNSHAVKQGDPLAALTALLPAARAAAQACGFPALEAEQRCDALRAACVEEQRSAVDCLAAKWAVPPCLPWESEDCERRWSQSIVGVKQALDRLMSLLALAPAGAQRQQEKPLDLIIGAAREVCDAADRLPHVPAYPRVEQLNRLRDLLADLRRQCERFTHLDLPLIHVRDGGDRTGWEWDLKRALDDLLTAAREHAAVAEGAPATPDPTAMDPERYQRAAEAHAVGLQECQRAAARVGTAWDRLWQLAQRIDMQPSPAPVPESGCPACASAIGGGAAPASVQTLPPTQPRTDDTGVDGRVGSAMPFTAEHAAQLAEAIAAFLTAAKPHQTAALPDDAAFIALLRGEDWSRAEEAYAWAARLAERCGLGNELPSYRRGIALLYSIREYPPRAGWRNSGSCVTRP